MRTGCLVVGLLCLLGPRLSYACSCVLPKPETDAEYQALVDEAALVFEGTSRGSRWDGDRLVDTFDVLRTFKGTQRDAVALDTGTTRDRTGGLMLTMDSCDSVFDPGRTYLVFAYRGDSGSLSSSVCSPTQPSRKARRWFAFLERESHDGGPPPVEPSAGCRTSSGPTPSILVLGLVGLFGLTRTSTGARYDAE